jgi:acyl carrier protein
MRQRIRDVVRQHGRLPVDLSTMRDDTDLYQAGLTSHGSVNLMLALEDEFEVEFPEALLQRRTFESIAAIEAALNSMQSHELVA